MGIENVESLSSDDAPNQVSEDTPPRPTDQEVEDRHAAELAEEREEHNRRTGGGNYPLSTDK